MKILVINGFGEKMTWNGRFTYTYSPLSLSIGNHDPDGVWIIIISMNFDDVTSPFSPLFSR